MREFKTIGGDLGKTMLRKWGFVSKLVDDGSMYGSPLMEDCVCNGMLGVCHVRDIKEAEDRNAIICQDGVWRVRTEPIIITKENKDLFHAGRHLGEVVNVPSKAFKEWEEEWFGNKKRQKKISLPQPEALWSQN